MNDDTRAKASGRRDFLKLTGAAAVGFLARPTGGGQAKMPPLPANPATRDGMPTRNLGRTGFRVGLFSLGGQAAIEQPRNAEAAVPLIERALDLGVNYIDTSARYGGAEERWSERYIGEVMKRRRREVFLATKTHDRTRDGSLRLLERSLELLNTDHIDLWQLHNLARKEEVEAVFAKDGAIEALVRAREQGVVRHVGISGHADPEVLLEAMRRFDFDTVLLALNAADRHRLPFQERLLTAAVDKEMGIIGMKVPARGRILSSWDPDSGAGGRWGGGERPGTVTMREAMRYVLSLPVSTVIVGCDSIRQLEENVEIARAFTPLGREQMAELESRTAPIARQALFFRRWEG